MPQKIIYFALLLCAIFGTSCNSTKDNNSTAKTTVKNDNTTQKMNEKAMKEATFGGGCFWCTEAVFQDLAGVQTVEAGYTGGTVVNPTYKQICTGETGHAEVIRIVYDSSQISYEQLLEVFFQTHDPTTLNRQGGDEGTQYRSVVFYHDEQQKQAAEGMKIKAKEWFDAPIVTEISALPTYYPAENYHQDYFDQNGDKNPYCTAVISPKLAKFRKQFKPMLKENIKP
jgi:peptide-methionine (S)-S-oxide reductase